MLKCYDCECSYNVRATDMCAYETVEEEPIYIDRNGECGVRSKTET